MKRFIITAVFATLSTGAIAVNPDYDFINDIIGTCEKVSYPGPSGDYNIRCEATAELVEISRRMPNTKFLSETEDFGSERGTPTILINAIPNDQGEHTCYRVLANGIDITNPPENEMWAISVCP
ncbi:MAG: hypothetical protein FWG80_04105 [Alphaproteobacteria bacterium]|nr:hypothetical protein [Alphaproteobacteria bacterium]